MAKEKKFTGLFEVNLQETDARVFLLFVQTAEAVLKYSEAVLNRAGLSLVKLMVLQLLQTHGGTLTPTEIARFTLREKHNITTLIRRMKKDRLIKIQSNKKDRRSIQITITENGKQAITDSLPAARNIVKQIMSSIPNSSVTALEEPLKILRKNAYDGLVKDSKH